MAWVLVCLKCFFWILRHDGQFRLENANWAHRVPEKAQFLRRIQKREMELLKQSLPSFFLSLLQVIINTAFVVRS